MNTKKTELNNLIREIEARLRLSSQWDLHGDRYVVEGALEHLKEYSRVLYGSEKELSDTTNRPLMHEAHSGLRDENLELRDRLRKSEERQDALLTAMVELAKRGKNEIR